MLEICSKKWAIIFKTFQKDTRKTDLNLRRNHPRTNLCLFLGLDLLDLCAVVCFPFLHHLVQIETAAEVHHEAATLGCILVADDISDGLVVTTVFSDC